MGHVDGARWRSIRVLVRHRADDTDDFSGALRDAERMSVVQGSGRTLRRGDIREPVGRSCRARLTAIRQPRPSTPPLVVSLHNANNEFVVVESKMKIASP
jgi:hypothetical protein